jgi:hypothetical protein
MNSRSGVPAGGGRRAGRGRYAPAAPAAAALAVGIAGPKARYTQKMDGKRGYRGAQLKKAKQATAGTGRRKPSTPRPRTLRALTAGGYVEVVHGGLGARQPLAQRPDLRLLAPQHRRAGVLPAVQGGQRLRMQRAGGWAGASSGLSEARARWGKAAACNPQPRAAKHSSGCRTSRRGEAAPLLGPHGVLQQPPRRAEGADGTGRAGALVRHVAGGGVDARVESVHGVFVCLEEGEGDRAGAGALQQVECRAFGLLQDFECACGIKQKPFGDESYVQILLDVKAQKKISCPIRDVD